jgi:hypothetical protein
MTDIKTLAACYRDPASIRRPFTEGRYYYPLEAWHGTGAVALTGVVAVYNGRMVNHTYHTPIAGEPSAWGRASMRRVREGEQRRIDGEYTLRWRRI